MIPLQTFLKTHCILDAKYAIAAFWRYLINNISLESYERDEES